MSGSCVWDGSDRTYHSPVWAGLRPGAPDCTRESPRWDSLGTPRNKLMSNLSRHSLLPGSPLLSVVARRDERTGPPTVPYGRDPTPRRHTRLEWGRVLGPTDPRVSVWSVLRGRIPLRPSSPSERLSPGPPTWDEWGGRCPSGTGTGERKGGNHLESETEIHR